MSRVGYFLTSIIFLAVFQTGCATSIVLKPEVYEIEKLAIVSLYSNHGVYNIREGSGMEESISVLGSLSGENHGKKFAAISDFGGNRLVDYSLRVYERELGKIKGWKLVPFKKLKRKRAYTKFTKGIEKSRRALATISKKSTPLWKTPRGMSAFNVNVDESAALPKLEVEYLKQLAISLGLNAVAVIQMDLGYNPHIAKEDSNEGAEGTGTAKASVSSSIKIVTAKGHIAVLTPNVEIGKGLRFDSQAQTAVIGGDIRFNRAVENMYKDAITKGAVSLRKKISQAM